VATAKVLQQRHSQQTSARPKPSSDSPKRRHLAAPTCHCCCRFCLEASSKMTEGETCGRKWPSATAHGAASSSVAGAAAAGASELKQARQQQHQQQQQEQTPKPQAQRETHKIQNNNAMKQRHQREKGDNQSKHLLQKQAQARQQKARPVCCNDTSAGIKLSPDDERNDCAKCQLIVRWASAQAAQMAARAANRSRRAQSRLCRPSADAIKVKPNRAAAATANWCRTPRIDPGGQDSRASKDRFAQICSDSSLSLGSLVVGRQQECRFEEEEEEAEISSLTESSMNGENEENERGEDWSISSCYEEPTCEQGGTTNKLVVLRKAAPLPADQRAQSSANDRLPSFPRRRRCNPGAKMALRPQLRKLRPAPLPPLPPPPQPPPPPPPPLLLLRQPPQPPPQPPVSRTSRALDKHQLHGRECANSTADSGNTSGADTSRLSSAEEELPVTEGRAVTAVQQQQTKDEVRKLNPKLLTESEVFSIEHFLKSHKSSVYVCGCMANLYLTSTELVNNGRCSKPTSEGWQLSKTGVPVLTFDSGLARNRSRRKLSVSLAERGSGFILWSDTIDHLSSYRAFCSRVHGGPAKRAQGQEEEDAESERTCDTFHVLYLSTNHRIMAGLSFDDPTCARLFLKQVELVTSDPANIALTGPKLAQRLASAGRLGRLLSPRARTKRARSIGCVAGDLGHAETAARLGLDQVEAGQVWASNGCLQAEQARAAKAGPRSRIARIMLANSSPAVDYTWSTLKRAIKLGQQRAQPQPGAQPFRLAPVSCKGQDCDEERLAAFRPKPLPSLAMAGKAFRAGKKLPRKCDISAPCLFQHVTRVDLNGLERLHSKSLVSSSASLAPQATTIPGGGVATNTPIRSRSPEAGAKQAASNSLSARRHSSHIGVDQLGKLSLISANERGGANAAIDSAVTSNFSTSSCYSSASNSPASSEYAGEQGAQLRQPLRPLPPRRSSSTQNGAVNKPVAPPNAGNKIQAIIRELQAQTSAELVEAKRKLMADIADRVMVRANSASALSSSIVSHL